MKLMNNKVQNRLLLTAVTVLLVVMTFGCGADPQEIQDEFLGMLDEPASEESIDSIAVFLDSNLKYMDEDNADNMVISLEQYAYTFNPNYLLPGDLCQRYKAYISEPLQELYSLRTIEQEKPMSDDAQLKISWGALCKRALSIEQYIGENKDVASVRKDAEWLYTNYINAMIMGTTGTPIFDYETGNFNQEALIAYYDFTKKNPDTTVSWVINEYIVYLENVNYHLDYNDAEESKDFFNTCTYLAGEAGKRAYQ